MQGQKCRLAILKVTEEAKKEGLDKNCAVKVGANLRGIQTVSDLCIKYPVLNDISTTALYPLTRKNNRDVQEEAIKQIVRLLQSRWNPTLKTYHLDRWGSSPVSALEVKKIINKLKGKPVETYTINLKLTNTEGAYRIDTPIDDNLYVSTFIAVGKGAHQKSSMFRGVYWKYDNQRWKAQINIKGNMRSLGYFDLEEDAARAYDEAYREAYGIEDKCNFKRGT